MAPLTEDALLRLAAQRGWPMAPDRIRTLLPEVQRLLEAAARLRELPLDQAAPPDGPA
jgi:hypothetical protein